MTLLTRQSCASGAAERWRKQYADRTAPFPDGREPATITVALEALGPTPNPSDVDRIIGNASWTATPSCTECDAKGGPVVRVGEESDYDSSTVYLCRECARKVLGLFAVPQ